MGGGSVGGGSVGGESVGSGVASIHTTVQTNKRTTIPAITWKRNDTDKRPQVLRFKNTQ